jgi:ectoine hydroxylase-related dioxygenase (phytanoyl-CoA dioxygenase family)|tara:strand:- start:153 stop:974 length:822 start_codon:yes stop_codon:yes gene_type:complete
MKNPLGTEPRRRLTQNERYIYENDGVALLSDVLDSGWIDFLRNAFEEALSNPGSLAEEYAPADGPGRFFADLNMWQRIPAFRQFVFESPAAKIAAEVMRASRINFFYDQMFVKESGTLERTPWHQDQPYWAVSGQQVCSVWIPLDPVQKESSLQFVKGSHRWPAHNPHHFGDDSPYEGTGLPELPNIESKIEEYEILSWNMVPGDCLVFQGMSVHGSPGNTSEVHRRRALATRWCGDDARYRHKAGEVAIPTSDSGLADGDLLDCDLFPSIPL